MKTVLVQIPDRSGTKPEEPRAQASVAPPPPPSGDGDADFTAIFRVMWRRRVFILLVAAGILAAATPLIMMMERTYTAHLRLLLNRPSTIELAAPGSEHVAALDLSTELERLLAQANVLQVVGDLDLASREEFRKPAKDGAQPAPMDDVLAKFYEALSIRRDGQSNVIQIGFVSRDPQLAALIPNALVNVYLAKRETQLQSQVTTAKAWMEGRIDDERRRISDLEAEQNDYRLKNGPLSPEFQMAAVYQISTLEGRQFAIAQSRADMVTRLSRLENLGNPDADATGLADLQRDLQTQNSELARLLNTYGESYAGVSDLRETIGTTEAAIARATGGRKALIRADIDALDAESISISSQLATQRDGLSRMGVSLAAIAEMERNIAARRDALARLEDQMQTLATEGALPVAEAEILSPATVPVGPTGQGRKFYLLLAAVAGLCIGATLACGLELMDRSLRSQQQLRGIPGTRVGGLIPRRTERRAARLIDDLMAEQGGAFAESLNWLMLLLRKAYAGRMPGSILIASGLPGEGKSKVAAALAANLQMAGHRVLLVDCDLVRGTVHTTFGAADPANGLSNFLAGHASLDRVVRGDDSTGIAYVTRGGMVTGCDWSRMDEVTAYARDTGRLVIFDSAPVLASGETVSICGLADATILIVRWGKTVRRTVDLAIARLRIESRSDILLAINDVDPVQHAKLGYEDSDLFAHALRPYHVARSS